ncbi:MAG TPA: phosphonoacetaldehyde dehydrogenase [Usitatibacter sp.]|nr:phosphonoacetaldehyde dehydrogenase [Usitatibacter sp.]
MNDRASGERVIEVRNPFTREVVGTVPRASVADVKQAFEAAHAYRPDFTRFARAEMLRTAARLLRERIQEASDLITRESGLGKKDSTYEIGRVCDVFEFSAMEALRDDGQAFSCDITPHGRARRVFTRREPLLGVISAITPFNHPMNQVAHKVAPAIATNNRMVVKPSERTPLSALYLVALLHEAGVPKPMLQVVTGDPREIATELVTNENVDLVTFTGGVAAGKSIAAQVGYRRIVLELGGNDPLIVMEDADLDEASTLAVNGSYRNSGQRCTAVKRILVHESVAGRFVDLLVDKTRAWTYGDPTNAKLDMGTVIDENAAELFESRVNEAVSQGAKLLVGNKREGALYSPTVIDAVSPSMTVVRQETFGPVSPVIRFSSIDEAIDIANGTAYGLSSAVCTQRLDYITRFVSRLQVGTVNVREVPGYRLELTPFGGIKDSGLGYKEGVQEAMKSFTNVKTFSLPWE